MIICTPWNRPCSVVIYIVWVVIGLMSVLLYTEKTCFKKLEKSKKLWNIKAASIYKVQKSREEKDANSK